MSADEIPPLIEPRVPKLCKDRTKLIDFGFREKFWEAMEQSVRERRRPDNLADRAVQEVMNSTQEPVRQAARERARERFMTPEDNRPGET
jgi:hypothetical protein